jgi:DeoR/GlpR family transcriptional regulator of sugar metabolism
MIYLSEERYSFKSRLHLELKRRIARKAASMIRSGQTLALDGGSTILELTQQLVSRLKGRGLYDLTVVTHFLPTAYALLTMLSESGLGDFNSPCTVYVAGGRGRPISMTLISARSLIEKDRRFLGKSSEWMEEGFGFRGLLNALGGVDIAFLGTNGLYKDEGFAVSNPHEVPAKRLMIEHAKQPVVLADASKFAVQQSEPFALFCQGLTVITAPDPEYSKELEDIERSVKLTPSTLVLA